MNREAIEASVATVSGKATYVGAGTAGIGAWLSSNALSLVGVVLAVLGFVVNWYFKREQDRRDKARYQREQAEHEARMRKLMSDFDPLPKAGPMGEET